MLSLTFESNLAHILMRSVTLSVSVSCYLYDLGLTDELYIIDQAICEGGISWLKTVDSEKVLSKSKFEAQMYVPSSMKCLAKKNYHPLSKK